MIMNKEIYKWDIWIADLDPPHGSEPGKQRPVVVIQTDMLNGNHSSTLICPLTTQNYEGLKFCRVYLKENETNIKNASYILVDQIRSIDNDRFLKKVGTLSLENQSKMLRNIAVMFDLDEYFIGNS